MKINLSQPRQTIILTLLLICFLVPAKAQLQNPSSKIAQSTYYDALGLYYALQGIPAFPVELNTQELGQANRSLDKKAVKPEKLYKIIETSSGKILSDRISPTELPTHLQALKVGDAIITPIINSILCRNSGQKSDCNNDINISSTYANNPYLKEYIIGAKQLSNPLIKRLSPDIFLGAATPSTKGGNITPILEGLAEFYIARVSEEINDAFLVQLKKVLAKYPEIEILFPKSKVELAKLDVIHYNAALNSIRDAFETDMTQLLGNFSKLATLSKYVDLINKYDELTLLFLACDLAHLVQQQQNPAEIIHRIGIAPYITKTGSNPYNTAVKLAALTSYSFRDIRNGEENKESKAWVSFDQIDLLRTNTAFFEIFMGLYAQSAANIKVDNKTFQDVLFSKKEEVVNGKYLIFNFSDSKRKIENFAVGLTTQGITRQDKIRFYSGIADELLGLGQIAADVLPTTDAAHFKKVTDKLKSDLVPAAKKATEIMAHLDAKNYGSALLKADTLLVQLAKFWSDYKADKGDAEVAKISDRQVAVLQTFKKYGLFIATVAEAKEAADVKNAISAFSLPKGSSRIKKEVSSSFGINSYVGVYHSWNKAYDGLPISETETGITAPIGFSYNKGRFLGGSLTAYAGVIDIGAIFSYKVETNSALKSEINFSQVLSPSLGLIYGLPLINDFNIPLSIGANIQWGPRLKKVNETTNSTLPLMTSRVNVFVAFDLPIVNFYTSKK